MNNKVVFVCGLHRSGTSLLFKCLKEHPAISGFEDTGVPEDEGQHLQSVYLPAHALGGARRFGFDQKSHLTETSSLITPQNKERLYAEWGKYWDVEKPILVEKSPPNLTKSRFLQEMFPDSYFIVIMRHPIASSFPRSSEDKAKGIYSAIKHWLVCHEIFHTDKAHLKKVLVMKYESFVVDPDLYLGKIFSFLDIPHYPTSQDVRSNINRKYFDRWDGLQKKLSSKLYTGFIKSSLEKRVNGFGYSLRDLERIDPEFESNNNHV